MVNHTCMNVPSHGAKTKEVNLRDIFFNLQIWNHLKQKFIGTDDNFIHDFYCI